jgi:hypothetical protein
MGFGHASAKGCGYRRAEKRKRIPPTSNSKGHCERQRGNLGPLSARSVEIASSRKALLAMTACQVDRNLI